MAQLTDQLPVSMNVKPVREPPAPSTGLATALGFLSKGVEVFAEDRRRNTVAKRQAEQDAYTAIERRIPFEANQSIQKAQELTLPSGPLELPSIPTTQDANPVSGDVFGTIVNPMSGDALDSSNLAVGKLFNIKAAVSQNKMPGISLNAAINQQFQALMNRFPDHGEAISKYFRERGFNPSLDRTILDEQSGHEAMREQGEKWEGDMFKAGSESVAPELLAGMTREQVIAQGAAVSHTNFTLDQASKSLAVQLQRQNLSAGEKKAAQEELDNKVSQTTIVDAYNNSVPLFSALQQVMVGISKLEPGKQVAAFAALGPQYDQWSKNYKANAIARAQGAGATQETIKGLSSQLDDIIDRGRSLWSGDMSVASANQQALTTLKNTVGLDIAKTLPVYFALQQMGMKPDEIVGYSQGIQQNTKLSAALKKEMSGFTGEFGAKSASTHLKDIVDILKGRVTLQDFTPEEARVKLPTLYTTTQALTQKYAQGSMGVDGDTVLHGIGEMINAARTLGPGTADVRALTLATAGIASQNTWKSLIRAVKDPVHNDQAEATISGSRAASAGLLFALQPELHANDTPYWKITVDKTTGRARAVPTGKVATGRMQGPGREGTTIPVVGGSGPVPEGMKRVVDSFNTNINNLVALNNYDPNGLKNVTPLEVAKYYGAGITPKSMLDKKTGKAIDPQQEVDRALENLGNAFTSVPEMNQPVTISDGKSRGERNNNRGNIEDGSFAKSQPGYVGSDGRFAKFETPEDGDRAQATLLRKNYIAKGFDTPSKIVWRYGNDPGTQDDESVRNYVAYVARKLGIGPDDKIDVTKTSLLAQAMREFETGNRS